VLAGAFVHPDAGRVERDEQSEQQGDGGTIALASTCAET
jgi:hypothetical protein